MNDHTHWQLLSFVHAGRPHRRRYRSPIVSVDTQEPHIVAALERAALVGGIRLRRVEAPHPELDLGLDEEDGEAA